MQPGRSLVFVYNVDSGILPRMKDMSNRVGASEKAGCNLYAVTFSPIGMKKEWKRFIQNLGTPVRFLSRNEFSSEFRTITVTFPAVFLQTGNDLVLFISTDEINQCAQLEDLIALVKQRHTQLHENRT
jgi:hypothetical protein